MTAKAGKAQDFSSLAGSWELQTSALEADVKSGSAPTAASCSRGLTPAKTKP